MLGLSSLLPLSSLLNFLKNFIYLTEGGRLVGEGEASSNEELDPRIPGSQPGLKADA